MSENLSVPAERGQWSGRMGFILAAAGSAVGLGNIWGFPYLAGMNGGGSFVLVYLLCVALIGFPIMIAEIVIGRSTAKSPVGAFESLSSQESAWRIVGFLGVLTGFLILSFYSVVAGWTLNYFFMCATNFFSGKTQEEIGASFGVLLGSPGIQVFWHFLFMGITMGIVYRGVKKGIEGWAKILMPALFVMILGIVLYSLIFWTGGFRQALSFTFLPHEGLRPSSVIEALGQAFFSLSLGMGAMMTYGSYLSKEHDVARASLAVCVTDTLVALTACLMIFPILFAFGRDAAQGPGLVFQTMPFLFSQLRIGLLVSMVFFLLLSFAALTSTISLLEVVSAYFIDEWKWDRKKAVLVTGIAIALFGIPSTGLIFGQWSQLYGKSFFDTVFELAFNWMLPIGGLCIALFAGWFMDRETLKKEFESGSRTLWFFPVWLWLVRVVAPLLVVFVLLNKSGIVTTDMINSCFGY